MSTRYSRENVTKDIRQTSPSIKEVRRFWESNPFYLYGSKEKEGSKVFFEDLDRIKGNDTEVYTVHLWKFDKFHGKRVLDIGCGPGWCALQYAKNGAKTYAIDLTHKALELTKKHFAHYNNLICYLARADVQNLPFKDGSFDFISGSGVLHHAPDIRKAISEVHRVLKLGGRATFSVYNRNLFLNKYIFPITRLVIRLTLNVPKREGIKYASSPEEFVRMYDGDDNPVGRPYDRKEIVELFSQFSIDSLTTHTFLLRFFPFGRFIPHFIHRLLDRFLGIQWYIEVRKNES